MADTPIDTRRVLQVRLEALLGREAKIAKHLRGQDGRHDANVSDIASYTNADEVLEGLEEAAQREVGEIRAALVRIDAGGYGICVDCGGAVQPDRLAALPHAARCVECETQKEG